MLTLSESIGRGARAIRVDAGLTLEAVAKSARRHGLPWSTGKVSDLESGRIAATMSTLIALATALGAVAGRSIRLTDLIAGEGRVRINDQLSLEAAELRAALSGKPVATAALAGAGALVTTAVGIHTSRLPKWAREINPPLLAGVLSDFSESDTRMCKSIGADRDVGAAAMTRLWGRTFTAERDRRAGPDANAQHRGIIARRLKAELQELIERGDD